MAKTRRLSIRGGLAAIALLLAPAPGGAESLRDAPTFGIDVEIVSLNLAVTNPRGGTVADVSAQDLAIFEDGVRQQVSLFTQEKWPITLAVLIDASASMSQELPTAQAAALRLLRTLGPQDRALVAQFNERLTILQDFTSDPEALEAAVGSVETDGETALHTALYITLKDLAAQRREGEMERQALVVLSDGTDTTSAVSAEQVLELAREGEVNVYTIRPQSTVAAGRPPEPLDKYFLTTLTRETGGRAFFPAALTELEGVYEGIADELRTLYGVAYASTNARKDGQWRSISIRTLRPNLLLRHRPGYYAAPAPRLARGQ